MWSPLRDFITDLGISPRGSPLALSPPTRSHLSKCSGFITRWAHREWGTCFSWSTFCKAVFHTLLSLRGGYLHGASSCPTRQFPCTDFAICLSPARWTRISCSVRRILLSFVFYEVDPCTTFIALLKSLFVFKFVHRDATFLVKCWFCSSSGSFSLMTFHLAFSC